MFVKIAPQNGTIVHDSLQLHYLPRVTWSSLCLVLGADLNLRAVPFFIVAQGGTDLQNKMWGWGQKKFENVKKIWGWGEKPGQKVEFLRKKCEKNVGVGS